MGQGGEILRCQGGRSPVASPWNRHYIRTRGAARRVRSHIPGALSILKGAVPDRARGLGHMAPTYFRREPGIAAPTALAAPHAPVRRNGAWCVARYGFAIWFSWHSPQQPVARI